MRQLNEAAAQALHLFLGGGPQIISRGDCAQPARGGNRLQSGHARPNDEHACRRDGSRCRGQHGENPRQSVGGDQHCLVAADRAHGGKRVHALRARGARHQFDGERRHAGGGDLAESISRDPSGRRNPIRSWLAAQKRKIGCAGDIVGAVAEHLDDDICRAKHGRSIRENLRALFDVVGVPVTRFNPAPSLDDNFKTGLDQARHDHGNQPHAPFTGITFSRNADNHFVIFLKTNVKVWPSRHHRGATGLFWAKQEYCTASQQRYRERENCFLTGRSRSRSGTTTDGQRSLSNWAGVAA